MKISVSQIKSLGTTIPSTSELIKLIGEQLGAVESVVDLDKKYDKAVVVKVVSVEKHPNADRLHLCRVDDAGKTPEVPRDDEGLIQVVCGASNVHAGLMTVWLPPASIVPSSLAKEPIILEARVIRDVTSYGMLASSQELDLSNSHDGILELDGETTPGQRFADLYDLNDVLIDIENKMFTHRPDCFGQLGVAREIAGIQGTSITNPEWYKSDINLKPFERCDLKINFSNELPQLVRRVILVPVKNLTVAESPLWLQVSLSKLGCRSVNNVVDLTNFYMYLTGQPTHAYDLDKIQRLNPADEGPVSLSIRNARPDEKITLLSGRTIEPGPASIMVASQDRLIGLAGIMGGVDTEVDQSTHNILLECATFDMYEVRKAAMELGIFTEASTRFTKNQSPLQNTAVLNGLLLDLFKLASPEAIGEVVDDIHIEEDLITRGSLYPDINISTAFINNRLGSTLSADEIRNLLVNVGFSIKLEGEDLTVRVPFWRTDVEIREDVIEEVGRLYGYNRLPQKLPLRNIYPVTRNADIDLKYLLRKKLLTAGANEILTYSFVPKSLLDKAQQSAELALSLSNALSPELEYYRLSLTPSLLDKVHPNIKLGYESFALYEIGVAHPDKRKLEDGVPVESSRLALVLAEKLHKGNLSAYYQAKMFLEAVAGCKLSYKSLSQDAADAVAMPFEPQRSAFVYVPKLSSRVGVIGEFKDAVKHAFKLPEYSAGFEIDLDAINSALGKNEYRPLSRFPLISQDITFKISKDESYEKLYNWLVSAVTSLVDANTTFDLSLLDIFDNKADNTRHYTFHLELTSYKRTLQTDEVNRMTTELAKRAALDINAQRV